MDALELEIQENGGRFHFDPHYFFVSFDGLMFPVHGGPQSITVISTSRAHMVFENGKVLKVNILSVRLSVCEPDNSRTLKLRAPKFSVDL